MDTAHRLRARRLNLCCSDLTSTRAGAAAVSVGPRTQNAPAFSLDLHNDVLTSVGYMHTISSNPAPPPATRFFQKGGGGADCWLTRRWVGLPSRGMVCSGAAAAPVDGLLSISAWIRTLGWGEKESSNKGGQEGVGTSHFFRLLPPQSACWVSRSLPAYRGVLESHAQLGYHESEALDKPQTEREQKAPHDLRSGRQNVNFMVG